MNISGFTIDAVLALIFIICLIVGRSKGFFRTIATFACTIIAIFLAKSFAEPAGQWLNDNFIHERLVDYFSQILQENAANGAEAVIGALPEYLVSAAKNAGSPLINILAGSLNPSQIESLSIELATTLEAVFKPLITGLGYFLVFIGFKLASFVIILLFSFIFKLPSLNQVNRLVGLIIGALKGLIIVTVISSLLMLCQSILEASDFAQEIASSRLVPIFSGILSGILIN